MSEPTEVQAALAAFVETLNGITRERDALAARVRELEIRLTELVRRGYAVTSGTGEWEEDRDIMLEELSRARAALASPQGSA